MDDISPMVVLGCAYKLQISVAIQAATEFMIKYRKISDRTIAFGNHSDPAFGANIISGPRQPVGWIQMTAEFYKASVFTNSGNARLS